jgi:hypothetical protein
VVWRGIIYTVLMALGKCAVGVWMIILPFAAHFVRRIRFKHGQEKHSAKEEICTPFGTPSASFTQTQNASFIVPPVTSDLESQPPAPRDTHDPPQNYYAALLLALAMTARGEIGFLIAAVGESYGLLVPNEIYLVVVWAITLCTFLAPIGVGFVVRRIEKAEADRPGMQILGAWR